MVAEVTREGRSKAPIMGAVLLVDAECELQAALSLHLRKTGYRVMEARDGHEALKVVERERLSLVIIDPKLIDMNGIKLGAMIRERSNTPFLFITGGSPTAYAQAAEAVGAVNVLSKRSNIEDLVTQVQLACKHAIDVTNTRALNQTLVRKLNSQEKRETMIGALMVRWGVEKGYVKATLDSYARSNELSIDHIADVHHRHSETESKVRAEYSRRLKQLVPDVIRDLDEFHGKKQASSGDAQNGRGKKAVRQDRAQRL